MRKNYFFVRGSALPSILEKFIFSVVDQCAWSKLFINSIYQQYKTMKR